MILQGLDSCSCRENTPHGASNPHLLLITLPLPPVNKVCCHCPRPPPTPQNLGFFTVCLGFGQFFLVCLGPRTQETHSWLRMEPVNAQFRRKPTISCLFCRFSAIIIGKTRLAFWGMGGREVAFLIRKRFNFPEPFRLVRKTLLISFSRI